MPYTLWWEHFTQEGRRMIDQSLYERSHRNRQEQAFGMALGVIKDVDPPNRLCTVATLMGAGSMNDQYIHKCQWLSVDANPDGDEFSCIPRRGTMGIVLFIDGESFFWGAFKPLSKDGIAAQGTEAPSLTEGDKVISTLAGNRLTLKRSGLIELSTSDTLKRIMMPKGSKIFDICSEYNLNVSSGGVVKWNNDLVTKNALYEAEFRKDLLRTYIVHERKGHVDPTIMYQVDIGPAVPGVSGTSLPVYSQQITLGGEITTTASLPQPSGSPLGFSSYINGPEGSISLKLGTAQTTTFDVKSTGEVDLNVNSLANLNISSSGDIKAKGPVVSLEASASGDLNAKNAVAKLSMSSSGEIVIDNKAVSVTISPSGEVKINAKNKVSIEAKAGVDIKSVGAINVESSAGPVSVKAKGMITLDGGTGASDFVLTNPTTLSPFTGAPLAPFSTTIKVSK